MVIVSGINLPFNLVPTLPFGLPPFPLSFLVGLVRLMCPRSLSSTLLMVRIFLNPLTVFHLLPLSLVRGFRSYNCQKNRYFIVMLHQVSSCSMKHDLSLVIYRNQLLLSRLQHRWHWWQKVNSESKACTSFLWALVDGHSWWWWQGKSDSLSIPCTSFWRSWYCPQAGWGTVHWRIIHVLKLRRWWVNRYFIILDQASSPCTHCPLDRQV